MTVVTAGHLSTCPRMLKTADALHGEGYHVRVVSTRHMPWAWEADQAAMARRSWTWHVVDYDKSTARGRQLRTGVRFRLAQALAGRIGPTRLPARISACAYSRMHEELVWAIAAEPADLVYGGTTGALAAVAAGAAQLGVPYALDLEDFHSAEQTGPGSQLAHTLAVRIERDVLPGAAFLTAGSPMIAEAYAAKYRVHPTAIHNTFPLAFGAARNGDHPLRLYWFSQTLGSGRGLESIVRAVGHAKIPAELHLRARVVPEYAAALGAIATAVAPSLSLVYHEPAPPDEMVRLAQGFDLGLACDEPDVLNRRLCLTNKIFTYLAAGVPMLMSATPAQTRLAADIGPAAALYEPGNVEQIAALLRAWADNPREGCAARASAREAAERRWHWEHPCDRGALVGAVARVVGAP